MKSLTFDKSRETLGLICSVAASELIDVAFPGYGVWLAVFLALFILDGARSRVHPPFYAVPGFYMLLAFILIPGHGLLWLFSRFAALGFFLFLVRVKRPA